MSRTIVRIKRNETYPCHNGSEKKEQAFPMSSHVCFRQLDSYSENSDCKNDTGDFQNDGIGNLIMPAAPASRIEYVGAIRT